MPDINYWSLRDRNYDENERMNIIIDLKRVEDIGTVPISLAEAKTQLRVTFTDDDTEITALILKSIRHVENYCNISIIYQRVQLIACMQTDWALPYGPVVGIESVSDSEGQTGSGPVTFTTSERSWTIDGDLYGPGGGYRQKIVYTTGGILPADLKDVCLQVLTFLYENRGMSVAVTDLQHILSNADRYKIMLWI